MPCAWTPRGCRSTRSWTGSRNSAASASRPLWDDSGVSSTHNPPRAAYLSTMFVSTTEPQEGAEPLANPVVRPPAGLAERLHRYRPGSSLPRILFYEFGRAIILTILTLIYRFRVYGGRR